METILEKIIIHKRKEVDRQKQAIPLTSLLELGAGQLELPTRSLRKALETSDSGIIAEFKRKSPSKGWIRPDVSVSEIIPAYVRGGASACSVLTDHTFFGGSLGDLEQARILTELPILRKDFIIDEYQIYQARISGADAILLIAACLKPEQCLRFAELAHRLQMEVLLEIHQEEEIKFLNPSIDLAGINNRNLTTFHTDTAHSLFLIEKSRKFAHKKGYTPLWIAESGISEAATIARMRQAGFKGFLIGEMLMRIANPEITLFNLIQRIV